MVNIAKFVDGVDGEPYGQAAEVPGVPRDEQTSELPIFLLSNGIGSK